MRIVVMGSGGVGGYFGGRLAAAGEQVGFIARGAHLRAMREQGLQIRSQHHGDLLINPVQVSDDPAQAGPADLILFCVKSWDTEEAGRALRPLIGPQTAVVSLQNGVDNEEKLGSLLGTEHLLGGVTYVEAAIERPGVIEQSSAVAKLVFGEFDGERSERAQGLLAACKRAGIEAELSSEIESVLWSKYLFICAFSGLTALTRLPIGPVRSDPDTRQMLRGCMSEVEAVARGRGVSLPQGILADRLAFTDRLLPEMRSSLQRDLERGHRLELEALNGTVVRFGAELGLEVPINRFIYAALKLHAGGGFTNSSLAPVYSARSRPW